MFNELEIDIDETDLKLLVDLRNKIIHTGIPNNESERWPSMAEAAEWIARFSSLVEKILLAILEYRGCSEFYHQSVTPTNSQTV